ncbi:FAD-dependent oxidoreductase [Seleniivibrio woodruffii]|uniref:dihydrouracil dehydrogenase (NAD(+)) n=1 Tax=Seleniivibrio woodruffii TaxID=1078050 RepID=A0A4R1K9B4_9BACT|nr:FAD-dependent oxidoreductase [Seleniivibrio woodruffii]TCK60607.1 glutamate synthase (NADPH) GltB3 subunit [Seleniivibrio woodruffii]TVZ36236.1 glutamate synthase (NADPH) GltB3 subunit [Seleniivibrio woodruffii]
MSVKTAKIQGIIDGKRVSTQNLLKSVYEKLDEGITEFEVEASGQHNIGGPLWTTDGTPLKFTVKNPGQRVGSMGMPGTEITINGSAPADVGWLNAGATIILKGDGGDTTAHCAASGKIYVAGRTGTRSGALMKHDPKFPAPEFWVLKTVGSFSFEFMGGGYAVVCGLGGEQLPSVLGDRGCAGMVGGTVYVRGSVRGLAEDVWLMELDDSDKDFLLSGLPEFLGKIERTDALDLLSDMSQWKKIVPKTYEEKKVKSLMSTRDFRLDKWVEGGIFGDLIQEDYYVAKYVETGDLRLKYPEWQNARYSAPCEYNCPVFIPTQKRIALLRQGKIKEALELVLEYSPFPASVCGQVCPNLCQDICSRKKVDIPVKIKQLGQMSKEADIAFTAPERTEKVAIIGSGSAGLTAAWHLRKLGYQVDVYEQDSVIGGKLKQVIPNERLAQEILQTEIKRILDKGVNVKTDTKVDKALFDKLRSDYSAVIVAIGAHVPVVIPFEGHERLVKGLDFLKEVNKGLKPKVGEKVVVIGAGNAAMDVVIGAYEMGAKEVTAIDIQKPAAFEHEMEHARKLGAKILWPVYTQKVTEEGVLTKDGKLIPADTVIIAIGDRPDFSFIDKSWANEKGFVKLNEYLQCEADEKVFVTGDAIKQGLFTHALGDGRKAAINVDRLINGRKLNKFEKAPVIPQDKVRDEYYHPLNPQRVAELEAEGETERCMSCGFCRDCSFCLEVCPEQAITRKQTQDGKFEYVSNPAKCIGCGICAGVCPCGVWTMYEMTEKYIES